MTACIPFRSQALQGARPHQFEAKVDDTLVGRQQIRVHQSQPVGQGLDLGRQRCGGHGLECQSKHGGITTFERIAREQQTFGPLWAEVVEPHV